MFVQTGVGIFWQKFFLASQNVVRGVLLFVQIWCQNFLAKIFFLAG